MKTNSKKTDNFSLVFELLFILLQLPYTIGGVIYLLLKPIVSITTTIFELLYQSTLFLIAAVLSVYSVVCTIAKTFIHLVAKIFQKIFFSIVRIFALIKNGMQIAISGIRHFFAYFPFQQLAAPVLFVSSIAVVAALTFFGLLHIENQPYPTSVSDFTIQQPIRIYDNNHYVLYESYTQSSSKFISPLQIPTTLSTSIVALKDPTFYSHPGITLKFVWDYCKEKLFLIPTEERLSITQQLAENALGGSAHSFPDRVQELILTFQLEKRYTKEQLLAMYLTIQPFGPEVGADHASHRLFNKSLDQLSDQESLLLASVINFDPLQEISIDVAFQDKYQQTITALSDRHIFSILFFEKNKAMPSYSPSLQTSDLNAVRLVFYEVTSQLPETYQIKNGLSVYSTIDLGYQNDIQRIVIENFSNSEKVIPQATVAVTDAKTGSVMAVTGYSDTVTALQLLMETTELLQQHANNSTAQTVHSVKNATTPQGAAIALPSKTNTSSLNQVQAQGPIVSVFANNTSITGWVVDNQTGVISADASKKIVDAIADHIVLSTTPSKNSSN